MSQSHVQGEYMFNMQEMVAGLKFTDDGKFDFFLIYGAVDRYASGTFIVEGKTIKLKSDKVAGKDFNVIAQSKTGSGYTLKFQDADAVFLDGIRCTFLIGGERHDKYADSKGMLTVPYSHCDSILVFHTLFPDFVTCIKDDKNHNNNFTLTLNSSLAQVSFKGIDFTIEDDSTLSCMHNYLIPVEGIRFKKQ